jgi:hypothetical protein
MMTADIKIVKLITGEELLAKILPSSIDILKMENPVRIVVIPNKIDPKTPNVGFAPWAEFSDDKVFEVDKRHVLTVISPIKEFINQYNTMFGKLIVPNSNLILPST